MSNQQGAKITVYWLEKSRAQRVIWLLEELKLEYNIKVFKRDKEGRAGPELKKFHPLGRSPTIGIMPAGSDEEIIVTESETILDYICDHFGPSLIPRRYPEGKDGVLGAETESWMRHKFLMDYAEGSLLTPLIVSLITSSIRSAPVPFFLRPITNGIANKVDGSYTTPELTNHLDFLETYLKESPSKGEYFCSEKLTSADIMMHFALEAAVKKKACNEQAYPTLYRYVRKLQELDSYKRAGMSVEKASGEKFVPFSET
ncbi:glutathione transferase [Didymella exigua CBS 183.55]|uniref:Glutathione transferase n=1 Tax=Didymella exigua CBS 183.55 TaxID=1150837 RepID=A0A6A5R5N6_9PLEO|nr:glutathione transferase [Didymella exigua CBS 183.55]KAF1922478.1 glutathione transferase [Didymella exigua CBS 183.55]